MPDWSVTLFRDFMKEAGKVGPWFVAFTLFAVIMKFLGIINSIERILIARIQARVASRQINERLRALENRSPTSGPPA